MHIRFLVFIILFLFVNNAFATTATFQEGVSGYSGTEDAVIRSAIIADNEHITGASSTRTSWGQYYILYFDLTSISSSATVTSATIQIYMNEQNCTSETVGVRQIEDPDASGAFPANSVADDVFNQYSTYRYKNEATTLRWQTGGAANNFTDVDDNAAEDTVASGACPGHVLKTLTVTNMVQAWVTTPSINSGMFFTVEDGDGTVAFRDRFDGTSSNRPLLTVNYTVSAAVTDTTIVGATLNGATIN